MTDDLRQALIAEMRARWAQLAEPERLANEHWLAERQGELDRLNDEWGAKLAELERQTRAETRRRLQQLLEIYRAVHRDSDAKEVRASLRKLSLRPGADLDFCVLEVVVAICAFRHAQVHPAEPPETRRQGAKKLKRLQRLLKEVLTATNDMGAVAREALHAAYLSVAKTEDAQHRREKSLREFPGRIEGMRQAARRALADIEASMGQPQRSPPVRNRDAQELTRSIAKVYEELTWKRPTASGRFIKLLTDIFHVAKVEACPEVCARGLPALDRS